MRLLVAGILVLAFAVLTYRMLLVECNAVPEECQCEEVKR